LFIYFFRMPIWHRSRNFSTAFPTMLLTFWCKTPKCNVNPACMQWPK
jgi:hypothetical protein